MPSPAFVVRPVMSQPANVPRAIFACALTNLGSPDRGLTVRNFGVTTQAGSMTLNTARLYACAARLTIVPDRGSWSATDMPQNV
jgi:hypothetical protein